MIERRRRLIKSSFKKDNLAARFDLEYPHIVQSKREVTKKFSVVQLEELLFNSTKNVA